MRGHFWTLVPHVADALRPPRTWGSPWSTSLADPRFGQVRLGGLLDELPGSRSLLIIVHGMSSTAEHSYVVRAAQDARRAGLSSLRLTLRGSGGTGEDIYHAGLVEDLEAALESPEVQAYPSVLVLGFSLGGHMVLRHALRPRPKVRAVAAMCSPIDLETGCQHIDHRSQSLYRHHLLIGLRRNAIPVERRRNVTLSDVPLRSIRSIRTWDDKVVAPRFGFSGAADYYQQMSVGPRIADLATPALLVFAELDPMIPARAMRPFLAHRPKHSEVRWMPGGHVRFPPRTRAVEDTLSWLRRFE